MNNAAAKIAKELLKKMTLKEKIGQMHQEPLYEDKIDEIKYKIRNGGLGSIILSLSSTAGNDEQKKTRLELLNELERIAVEEGPSGIPILFCRDVIHGHNTVLPIPLALSATFNPELIEEGYRMVAEEAANDGIHLAFSPMIDISRDPRWGRCIEGIGEDPYLGEKVAAAIVRGFQGNDYKRRDSIAACAKHYIGYGAVEGGRDYGKSEISDYTLRNYYLKPFRAAVNAGVAAVMNSFNEISGEPTTSSNRLINELLKDELGFEGILITDWACINKLTVQGVAEDRCEAARLAVEAGVDVDMVSKCYEDYLEELVNNGDISETLIDKAVFRILYIKALFGLFENPYSKFVTYDSEKHKKMAKRCSDEAMVLIKNKGHVLPLSLNSNICLAGPMLCEKGSLLGSWTLDGDLDIVNTIADVFKLKGINVHLSSSNYLWDDCFKTVIQKDCDTVVVFLGESRRMTGEANSLAHIEFPREQLEFIKKVRALGKTIIGVMMFGRPIAFENAEEYFDAILYAWHCGTCTAESIVSILFGETNPSGCLPMTFPRCTGQIPIYYNYPNGLVYGKYYYDNKVYAYNDCISQPMYPFGYGLSYTDFEYSNVQCKNKELSYEELENGKEFEISVCIKNTGSYDGKETSQCYIHDICASMTRPQRELKGISKNYFKSGEEKTIYFKLGFDELAFYNKKGEFKPEKGEFDVFIGRDCYAPKCFTIKIL